MLSFTPGPWHLSSSHRYVRKNGGTGWPAWNVCEINQSHERAAGDARLIVRAPELFDTVDTLCNGIEWLIENHPTIMGEADNEAVAAARALLARIRGE